MHIGKLGMHFIMRLVNRADSVEIDTILDAALARRQDLYPNWDMTYIALPKDDPKERSRLLSQIIQILQERSNLP